MDPDRQKVRTDGRKGRTDRQRLNYIPPISSGDNKTVTLSNELNSFLASRDFCHLLIIFVNSLEPDQDQQKVGPDLDPICLTLLKEFF